MPVNSLIYLYHFGFEIHDSIIQKTASVNGWNEHMFSSPSHSIIGVLFLVICKNGIGYLLFEQPITGKYVSGLIA